MKRAISLTLDRVPAGVPIFVDSSIFIYHFTQSSPQCRRFLERCERGDILGVTSVVVLAETAHRLMMIEAVATHLVSAGKVARKLREQPLLVKKLRLYRDQVERIPLMGIEVAPLEMRTFMNALDFQRSRGLLVNDSLVAAAATNMGAAGIASADRDFARLDIEFYSPDDLQ